MSSRPAIAVLLAALVTPACAALAQTADTAAPPPSRTEMRRACAADYQRLCSHVRPGGGALRQCFTDHAADLSPACLQVLQRLGTPAPPRTR